MANFKNILIILFITGPFVLIGQCLEGDCQDGIGEYRFKNGLYKGSFLQGEIHGSGVFSNKRGYSYEGEWVNGLKEGLGTEVIKKGGIYKGNFSGHLRHGYGEATLPKNRFTQNVSYVGQWLSGAICGEGTMTFLREVKRGRAKLIEENTLTGEFVNGVYQGRQTNKYLDEFTWEPYNLKTEHFQAQKILTEKEYKRIKTLASIDGEIVVSCRCSSGKMIFDASAILRKESSWWSSLIPKKTKSTILQTLQGEFDIIEWHARALEQELNKEVLDCNRESLDFVWTQLLLKNKECLQLRKVYNTETAWNPKKGGLKNEKIQDKWNAKVSKKLKKYKKQNLKNLDKLNKKIAKLEQENCVFASVSVNRIPIKKADKTTVQSSLADSKNNKKRSLQQQKKEKDATEKRALKDAKAKEKKINDDIKEKEKKDKEEKKRALKDAKAKEKKNNDDIKKKEAEQAAIEKQKKKAAKKLKRSQRSFAPTFPRPKQLE